MLRHPIPWTGNHCVQNRGPKTIGRFAQPNIGSNFFFLGRCPKPHRGGLPTPFKPPGQGGFPPPHCAIDATRGGSAPPLTPRFTTSVSHGKNLTQPNNLPLVVFFPQESLVIFPALKHPLFLYTKRTSQS